MAALQEEFFRELLNDFILEAAEHHQAFVAGLIELEKLPVSDEGGRSSLVEMMFREIHSLKGAARAVNQDLVEQLCMSMEGVFHALKKQQISLIPEMFDPLYRASDMLDQLLADIPRKEKSTNPNSMAPLLKQLDRMGKGIEGPPGFVFSETFESTGGGLFLNEDLSSPADPNMGDPVPIQNSQTPLTHVSAGSATFKKASLPDVEKPSTMLEKDTVRVATSKLFDILQQAEEMISIKAILDFQVEQLQNTEGRFSVWRRKWEEDHFREMTNGAQNGSPDTSYRADHLDFFRQHESELIRQGQSIEMIQRAAGRAIDALLLDIKRSLLHAFSGLLAIVPRIVRDVSREYDKEVELVVTGGEIEIDRRMLEELKDPLIHLIRNCIDHGIETKAQRLALGKPAEGRLEIEVTHEAGQNIRIRICDNGAGIRVDQVKAAAIRNGLIGPDEAELLSESALVNMIFASGISTSPFITDLSGRGLGMAIVAEKIEKMGGSVEVQTTPGQGTTFLIILPQTLAAFRGILIRAGGQLFIVPTPNVIRAIHVFKDQVKTAESKPMVYFEHEMLALFNLGEALGIRPHASSRGLPSGLTCLVMQSSQRKVVFVVDEILGEREGVVKNLGSQLKQVRGIAGTTLLGDGRIVPILQVSGLLDASSQHSGTDRFSSLLNAEEKESSPDRKRIMVVEDSITVRNMLRNLLEAAGFDVKTAVDGKEGFEKLRSEPFDLVVSDIEMPRMNGFELTAKIRQDETLTTLPVLLVTSLGSPDDQRRGMDAGANAYIVKGSFEKGNLLDAIHRLIG
jgi:two-component system chemotaxis sensor kinase CheA